MTSRADFHPDSDPAVPFPTDRSGDAPLWWFAEESIDPDAVLDLYNKIHGTYLPVDSVDSPRAVMSKQAAWDFLDEMIIRHLAKHPVIRFKEPPIEASAPYPDDVWITFDC